MSFTLRRFVKAALPARIAPRVDIHGRHSPDWMDALGPTGEVWRRLTRFGWGRPRRVVIPLLEQHFASMPDACWALVPNATALATFADKLAFARYAEKRGLGALVPRTIDPAAPTFPAVLKRLDLNAGNGVVVVNSRAELDAQLMRVPWVGHPVMLQTLIEARTDYVTHVVCDGGRIVWHCSYAYELTEACAIRQAANTISMRTVKISAADRVAFEKFLKPLGFDGPANIDYRRRADGSLAVFEINPRLGGSLMRPENVGDLAGALRAIIRHAKCRAPGARIAA